MGGDRKGKDGLYAVDIRVFLLTITAAMASAFVAGVSMTPPEPVQSTIREVVRSSRSSPTVHDSFFKLSEEEVAGSSANLHLPAGQHLLVDIEGVDGDFLNSEERLSTAMVDTVRESGLHMLSYHCHALIPAGVSCVGVLLESHISFHTWPGDGVITLDLFTCGSKPLLPAVATIERLFGIQSEKKPDQKIHTQWSHELRGFRPEEEVKNNYLADSSDLSLWVLSPLEMYSKKEVFSGRTQYQQVDVWDLVELVDTPSYRDILKHNMTPGDPRLKTPEYTTPDRLLFLDGIIQSVLSAESVYHEAMVHPAMFAHADPRHVAILGGGEGATLREVLKHKTVENVVMIEIDAELTEIVQQFLPAMSDCSDFIGVSKNCFDDDRVKIYNQDGREWFIHRYGKQATVSADAAFDVVLLDALDPEDESEMSDLLYNDENFLSSLINSLSPEGVLAIQVGTAATIDDPRPDFGIYRHREALFQRLESNPAVQAMFVYEEPHAGFLEPHSFLLVCKSSGCRSRWYARSDQVDYQIYERILKTHSKDRALSYFDGTTQRTYQWPKKGWETVYCRREPMPFECSYRNMKANAELHELDLDDAEASSFDVAHVHVDGKDMVKVLANRDIPRGAFIMAEHLASSLMITSRNYEGLQKNLDVGGGRVAIIADLLEHFADFAHQSEALGSEQHYVEVGGTVLIRRSSDEGEINVDKWLPPHPSGKRPTYSPVYERHRVSFDVFLVATKDIHKGDEVVLAAR